MTPHFSAMDMGPAVERLVRFYAGLAPEKLPELHVLYAPQARFKDPFNDVQGPLAIEAIFRHMYAALQDPHFVITQQVVQGRQCFLIWEFKFHFRRFNTNEPQTVHGASHLVFNEQGQVALHRDYWDAAEELYEKLPVLRALLRWLKRRATS